MNDTPAPNSRLQQALSSLVDLARSYGDAFKDAIHEYVESEAWTTPAWGRTLYSTRTNSRVCPSSKTTLNVSPDTSNWLE